MNGSSYHANSPKRFRPWSVPHRILQPDNVETTCFEGCTSETAHCILCLTFDEVKEAADELLSQLGRWIIDNKQGT